MPETNNKLINFPLLINIFLATIFAAIVAGGAWYLIKVLTPETIAVSGTSSTQISNRIATYSLTIEVSDKDKAKAVENLTARSKEIVQKIKDFGIPEKDVETTSLNIYQRQDSVYRDGVTTYELGDWFASYTITAKLRDLTRSEEFTSLLATVEKASMWGPNLTIDNQEIDEESLLTAAIDDAKKKAEAISGGMGKKLGRVVQISEGYYSPSYGLVRMDAGGFGGGGGMPIEPGSTETYKTVTVIFELR